VLLQANSPRPAAAQASRQYDDGQYDGQYRSTEEQQYYEQQYHEYCQQQLALAAQQQQQLVLQQQQQQRPKKAPWLQRFLCCAAPSVAEVHGGLQPAPLATHGGAAMMSQDRMGVWQHQFSWQHGAEGPAGARLACVQAA
jgi:hypothetical protein